MHSPTWRSVWRRRLGSLDSVLYALFYGLIEPAEKSLVANLVRNERPRLRLVQLHHQHRDVPLSLIFGARYPCYGPLAAFGLGAGVVTHKRDVGGFDRGIAADPAHRDADGRESEHRGRR